jgi:hypothetical protein
MLSSYRQSSSLLKRDQEDAAFRVRACALPAYLCLLGTFTSSLAGTVLHNLGVASPNFSSLSPLHASAHLDSLPNEADNALDKAADLNSLPAANLEDLLVGGLLSAALLRRLACELMKWIG